MPSTLAVAGATVIFISAASFGSAAAPPTTLPAPETSDTLFWASCREYANLRQGKAADKVQAQACRSFAAGFILGWEGRQNTPQASVPQRVCVTAGDLDSFIDKYMAARQATLDAEQESFGAWPASGSLMSDLAINFRCH